MTDSGGQPGGAAAVPLACLCGEVFGTPDELDEHFWAVFVPADDIGLDGKPHAEIGRHRPTARDRDNGSPGGWRVQ